MDNKKIIFGFSMTQNKKGNGLKEVNEEKEVKQRKVVEDKKWEDLTIEEEIVMIKNCMDGRLSKREILMKQQIRGKLGSYRSQDRLKDKYEESKFMTLDATIKLINEQEHNCYYCKNKMKLLYSNVREPSQWTLERIDNDYGHNEDNVKIACLRCNVRRRTMYHERYIMTHEIKNIVKMG